MRTEKSNHPITREEEQYIINNIKTKSGKQIALELGRSPASISERLKKLGLKSSYSNLRWSKKTLIF